MFVKPSERRPGLRQTPGRKAVHGGNVQERASCGGIGWGVKVCGPAQRHLRARVSGGVLSRHATGVQLRRLQEDSAYFAPRGQ